jgi:putative peptidoglycan lipid II flippase
MILNVILMLQFEHVGLALATALSASLNAGLLFINLRKEGVYTANSGWAIFAVKLLFANTSLVLCLYLLTPEINQWLQWSVWQRIAHLSVLIISAVVIYFTSIALTGIKLKSLVKPQMSR